MDNIAIKGKRIQLGLTQKEFSDALGLGKNGERTLRRWENGETNPSLIELHFIMDFAKSIPYPNPPKEKANFTFIDLFAGIGGIRLPFTRLGGYCKFTSEWDKFAQKTYKTNYGDMPKGDITQIPNKEIPDFDILLAGFPCQPFSAAGLKKGFSDTRGTLFFEIERIIEGKRPKVFLLENVKQLKGHDKGHTFKVIIEHLKALDYDVRSTILRAADFGIPQNRERLFIIGFDNKQLKPGQIIDFKFPIPPKTPTKIGNILEQNIDSKYTISDRLYAGHLRRKQEHLQKGNGFGFSVFNADSTYTNTISARYYKDGSEILIDQGPNKNPRKLTPRECARLQGFPDDFIIPVSDMQSYKQFGNSVSVPVVQAVANNIIAELKRLQWI